MYTRRSLVLGLLSTVPLLAQGAQQTFQVTGALEQTSTLSALSGRKADSAWSSKRQTRGPFGPDADQA
jgi:hypothetical protein